MDNELDELLDSALGDFDKNKEELENQKNATAAAASAISTNQVTIEKTNLNVEINLDKATPGEATATIDDDMKLFEEIFNDEQSKETLKQFQQAFGMFKSEDPNMFKEFEKIMETLNIEEATTSKNEHPTTTAKSVVNLYEDDIDDDDDRPAAAAAARASQKPLDKVLSDINKQSEMLFKNNNNTASASGGGITEEFLLSQLNLADAEGDDDPASSLLMQPLISMLFSKDILYPSLKMMLDNYTKYLETNREKLNTVDLNKYVEQKDCIVKMCAIYEQAKETDSQDEKSSQLKQILELLEKCGNPPKELVPEMSPFAGMGEGLLKDSCPIS